MPGCFFYAKKRNGGQARSIENTWMLHVKQCVRACQLSIFSVYFMYDYWLLFCVQRKLLQPVLEALSADAELLGGF